MTDTNPNNVTLAEALAFIKESGRADLVRALRTVALEEIDLGLDDREFDVADAISQMAYDILQPAVKAA